MNVLYIVGGEGKRYGSEIIAMNLLAAAKANGIHYTVIVAKAGVVSDACKELGISCYIIPFKFFVYKKMNKKLINVIKKFLWKSRAELLTKIATIRIEKALNFDEINLIHSNLSRDLLGGILSERHKIPHVWHIQELYNAHYQLAFMRRDQLEWMEQHAQRFIAISDTVSKDWINQGLPAEKVTTIYNGTDLESIIPKDSYIQTDILRLVMVGHIVPAKGQERVVASLAKLPKDIKEKVIIDFWGEGSNAYVETLKEMARNNDVKACFRGYCDNIGQILRHYDLGINCSRGEGFGLSTIEYMAAGLCPVVANTGANQELVIDKDNGFVFDFKDDESLTALITFLLIHFEERVSCSQKARKDALEKYTLHTMQENVYSLYKETIKDRDNNRLMNR